MNMLFRLILFSKETTEKELIQLQSAELKAANQAGQSWAEIIHCH